VLASVIAKRNVEGMLACVHKHYNAARKLARPFRRAILNLLTLYQ
jgi:hypothetical protein